MSQPAKPKIGTIAWMDLTVPNASEVRDFYGSVVGWKPEEVNMGNYYDYTMHSPQNTDAVSGICHALGTNANLPPQWLIYITVASLDESIETCIRLKGEVLTGPIAISGYGQYCVIRDPAGAVAALFEPES